MCSHLMLKIAWVGFLIAPDAIPGERISVILTSTGGKRHRVLQLLIMIHRTNCRDLLYFYLFHIVC